MMMMMVVVVTCGDGGLKLKLDSKQEKVEFYSLNS
jgi:hypothetical protein